MAIASSCSAKPTLSVSTTNGSSSSRKVRNAVTASAPRALAARPPAVCCGVHCRAASPKRLRLNACGMLWRALPSRIPPAGAPFVLEDADVVRCVCRYRSTEMSHGDPEEARVGSCEGQELRVLLSPRLLSYPLPAGFRPRGGRQGGERPDCQEHRFLLPPSVSASTSGRLPTPRRRQGGERPECQEHRLLLSHVFSYPLPADPSTVPPSTRLPNGCSQVSFLLV